MLHIHIKYVFHFIDLYYTINGLCIKTSVEMCVSTNPDTEFSVLLFLTNFIFMYVFYPLSHLKNYIIL